MKRSYDLVIVGGGPAGSTLATLVRKYNPRKSVLVLEKSAFPRHHIGESLLPGSIPILKEMGVKEKVEQAGFPVKFGARFVWGKSREVWSAEFAEMQQFGKVVGDKPSWQVRRSRYDQILLDHARECGADVLMEHQAGRILEKDGRVRGVVAQGPRGLPIRIESDILADCSGQSGFLAKFRKTRRSYEAIRNVAGYAYFRGVRWNPEFWGQPKTGTYIFIASTKFGWFWSIPLDGDVMSIGLVMPGERLKRSKVTDFRSFYFRALRSCKELGPALQGARLLKGFDGAPVQQDFFSASDWSYLNETACGPGFVSAGDAAFFLDPLLSSGVAMAHISGHRAAYMLTTHWRDPSPRLRKILWDEYDGFCRDQAASFRSLIQFWYSHDPNAARWWRRARQALNAQSPLDLSDKKAFIAVASGLTYHMQRAYAFGSEALAPTLKPTENLRAAQANVDGPWVAENLAVVEVGFFPKEEAGGAAARPGTSVIPRLSIAPDSVPELTCRGARGHAFLPWDAGALLPVRRMTFLKRDESESRGFAVNPSRLLTATYMAALDAVDGRRSVSEILKRLYLSRPLPRSLLEMYLQRLLRDLSLAGVLRLRAARASAGEEFSPYLWSQQLRARAARLPKRQAALAVFRLAEFALEGGNGRAAEAAFSQTIESGPRMPWMLARRAEARLSLGDPRGALRDAHEALSCPSLDGPVSPATLARDGLDAWLEASSGRIEREWIQEPLLLLRSRIYRSLSLLEPARRDVEEALSLNDRSRPAYLERSEIRQLLGDSRGARRDVKAASTIGAAAPSA